MTTQFKNKYGPWALITGANSGIGKELAREVARHGLNIVIVARRQTLLDEVANELENEFCIEVRTLSRDLTVPGAVADLEQSTRDLNIGLVIPNAGIEVNGEFVESDDVRNQQMLNLNVIVPEQMAYVFGKKLVERGKGGILFVSSLLGYQGVPRVANYSATKAYILSLGEALNVELGRRGVDVTVLAPGVTDTAMSAAMSIDFSKMPVVTHSPEKVARTGIRALGRKASVIPGLLNNILAFENRFIPRSWPVRMFDQLLRFAWKDETDVIASAQQT